MSTAVSSMPVPAFDALASLYLFHFDYLGHAGESKPSRQREKLRTLHRYGYLKEVRNSGDSPHLFAKLYDQVIEHWISQLPDGWAPVKDIFGSKGAAYQGHGRSTPATDMLFTGITEEHYMTFPNSKAALEYMKKEFPRIGEIEAKYHASTPQETEAPASPASPDQAAG